MYTLVLVRHGESEWNALNQFTGWTDVKLTEKGRTEALEGGVLLKSQGFEFDLTYTSYLKRAVHTLDIILEVMDTAWLPVKKFWELNERHYGALQGLNKAETAEKYGKDQVHRWRRSYGTPPPQLENDDQRYPGKERQYATLAKKNIPCGESLEHTVARMLPFIEKELFPNIKSGKRILISAHGNSLRALVKYLDKMSDEDIVGFEIPTGKPIVYELDKDLKPTKRYFLED